MNDKNAQLYIIIHYICVLYYAQLCTIITKFLHGGYKKNVVSAEERGTTCTRPCMAVSGIIWCDNVFSGKNLSA